MTKTDARERLSAEGRAFLGEAELYRRLYTVAEAVGTTPEEYLYRFERLLSRNPEAIFAAFSQKIV